MQQKSLIQYFISGFSLANRSLVLLLISVVLSIVSLLTQYVKNSPFELVLGILAFILSFISGGFLLSLPVFLVSKQQKKP